MLVALDWVARNKVRRLWMVRMVADYILVTEFESGVKGFLTIRLFVAETGAQCICQDHGNCHESDSGASH